jgi:hypothetical protein
MICQRTARRRPAVTLTKVAQSAMRPRAHACSDPVEARLWPFLSNLHERFALVSRITRQGRRKVVSSETCRRIDLVLLPCM